MTHTRLRPDRRRRRIPLALFGGTVAAASVAGSVVLAAPASAGVPAFPDNIVVFPDRDFVTVEGYQDHVGQTATVEVRRLGEVVGSARAVVQEGDVAFEINHPGGACWGAGTGLNVTPDIVPGDRVSIRFGTAATPDDDSTTVAGAFVDTDSALTGTELVIEGHIDPALDKAQSEQRVVNPELTGTDVARRDIRAVPGGFVRAPRGGYESNLEFPAPDRFRATYRFDTAETAQIAAGGGGERYMNWQVEDADANRQGLTIAEYGELGGPGMGGCPAGPTGAMPPAGSAQVLRQGTTAQVTWTPQTAVPGAAAVTGYSVLAIDPSGTPMTQTGVRTDASAKQATLTGLIEGTAYTFEVRSIAGGAMSAPFNIGTAGSGGQTAGAAANLTLSPAPNGDTPVSTGLVTATGDSGGQIWFSSTGPAYVNGELGDDVQLYKDPVPVTEQVTLHFAYFNQDGNVDTEVGTYAPGQSAPAPDAPTGLASTTVGQDRVGLTWSAVAGAAAYQVEVSPGLAAPIPATTATSQVVTGLTPNTAYTFTVKAKNAEGTLSGASNTVSVTTSQVADRVTVTRAQWKAGDFRVIGSASANARITVYAVNADGSRGAAIPGAIVDADALGAYDLRMRNNAPATNPGRIIVGSSGGGFSPVTTVIRG